MEKDDLQQYEKIVGKMDTFEYLGPEIQGEMLKRCTILENVEIEYSGSTQLNSEKL